MVAKRLLPVDAPPTMIFSARVRQSSSTNSSGSCSFSLMRGRSGRKAAASSALAARRKRGALDRAHDLDCHRAHHIDLACVWRGAIGERAERTEDELLVARAEEVDGAEGFVGVG